MVTGTVYAVAGAKGGVGKTTTSLNLGAALAATGRSVVVVELDLAMANFADFLALDVDPETDRTLHDVLAGDASVTEAVYDAPGGFAVVPSGTSLDGFANTDVDGVSDVLLTLRERYEVVLLDTGAGLSHETLLPLALAGETILVSTPRVASVRDAEKTKQLASRVGGTIGGIVFVRSGTGNSPPTDRIADFLDVPMLGHVPEDEAVPASQDEGQPVVTHAPDSQAADAYRTIAGRLASRKAIDTDQGQLASNAVRVRQETARHRGGFVFPEQRSDQTDRRLVSDGNGQTDASGDADSDSVADERSNGDANGVDDEDDTGGTGGTNGVVSDSPTDDTGVPADGDSENTVDADTGGPTERTVDADTGASTDGDTEATVDDGDFETTPPTADAAADVESDSSPDEEGATFRRRVGAVVQAVRKSF